LTLNGANGASITDATNGSADVVDVENSRITLSGLTISGGVEGVSCYNGSYCHLVGNTIQGASDSGVFVFVVTQARIDGGVIQNNVVGLAVSGDVVTKNLTVQQSSDLGVTVSQGGRLRFTDSASTNNLNYGIWVQDGSLTCARCSVNGNQNVGIYLDYSATAQIFGYGGPVTIANNGVGVLVTDAAAANFQGNVSVVGSNGQLAVQCNNSVTSYTRNAITVSGGPANTNCKN
jgi:hypothetical protein